ncbi:unnamed protein product, partial [Prorocentrum cordatum]
DFDGGANRSVLDFDPSNFEGKYLAAMSSRHLEATPHWSLPLGRIFAKKIPQWSNIWQISAVTEAPDEKSSWHVTCDRRLTVLQVLPTHGTGCDDVLEPNQFIRAGFHEDRVDVALCEEVRRPLGWDDDVRLVCHMGHNTRYNIMGCPECMGEIIYQVDQTEFSPDMGILCVFDWGATDPE